MQKISPCIWFNKDAEEAANLYVSLFDNSKIIAVDRYNAQTSKESEMPEGSVMWVRFTLGGQEFGALNGGTYFTLTPAISFVVLCESQEEIDKLWDAFSEDGKTMQCGWVTDKYGVTWQIVPEELDAMLHDEDENKVKKVWEAMLKMEKLDINELREAYM
ncbi:hypothetical protein A3K01_03855 [candidate division WWE3 bacterium RIFOXYD1_FULL_43_17]|uniref:PhnB-like domain-containing protein n=1 Tax=candidate division WWE3 bacterium RIFOXYD1_FULL_43_17 TaxID=1802652 RepID=A0A1F4XF78_UNCKA|nr:MAG: hypothetical protein A3K01_03855 [candidate division WWE3 bacterium RIFOXYD1_FULL_43_17]